MPPPTSLDNSLVKIEGISNKVLIDLKQLEIIAHALGPL